MERGRYVFPFMMRLSGNTIRTAIRTGAGTDYLNSSSSLQWQQWYHVAMTYRPGQRVIYIQTGADRD